MKTNMNKSVIWMAGLSAIGAMLIAACGSQDPLASEPDFIKNATPGFFKPAEPVPSKENMIISSNQTRFFFTETLEGQATITGRVLLDNCDKELSIDNIADFDGASYDPQTGIFSWTPPRGYVSGVNSTVTTILRVRLNALQKQTGITSTTTQDFEVTVARMERQPVIESESGFPKEFMREGETLRLVLIVRDEDAANQKGLKPRIFVQGPVAEPRVGDLSPFIRVASEDNPEQDYSNPALWKFTLNVNLQDVDLTKNSGDYYFRVTAVSRYGKMSATKEYRVAVMTDLQTPILSSNEFEATVGVDMNQDVMVMDPRQEGRVSVTVLNPSDLPEGFTFKCTGDAKKAWMNVCRAKWSLAPRPTPSPSPTPLPGFGPTPEPSPVPSPTPKTLPKPSPLPVVTPESGGVTPLPGPTVIGDQAVVKIRVINSSPVSWDKYSTPAKDYELKFKVVGK